MMDLSGCCTPQRHCASAGKARAGSWEFPISGRARRLEPIENAWNHVVQTCLRFPVQGHLDVCTTWRSPSLLLTWVSVLLDFLELDTIV